MIEIIAGKKFQEDVFYYFKKKRYTMIRHDITPVICALEQGNKLDNLNLSCGDVYKVRIANSSTKEGKSNGFRLLYYAVLDNKVYLLTIYSKKDDVRIPNDAQIATLARNLLTNPSP